MISREPTIERLAVARSLLLTPYGLDEGLITRTLAEIFTHRVDYADLYFQSRRSEAWSLEEGIVKSGSFNIDQGVGVRAVSGERTAFAYSDDIVRTELQRRAHARDDRAAAAEPAGSRSASARTGVWAASLRARIRSQPTAPHKVGCWSASSDARARKDPRIEQVMAGLAGEYEVVLVARADGVLAADVRPLVRLSVHGDRRAERGGRRESAAAAAADASTTAISPTTSCTEYVDESRARGAREPRSAAGSGGHDDRRARAGLAGRAAARSGRARPRRRFQPQRHVARSADASANRWRRRA